MARQLYPCRHYPLRCANQAHESTTCPNVRVGAVSPAATAISPLAPADSKLPQSREEIQEFMAEFRRLRVPDMTDWRNHPYHPGLLNAEDPESVVEDHSDYGLNPHDESDWDWAKGHMKIIEAKLFDPRVGETGITQGAMDFYRTNLELLYNDRKLSPAEVGDLIPAPVPVDLDQVQSAEDRLSAERVWKKDGYSVGSQADIMHSVSFAELARDHNYLVNVSAIRVADDDSISADGSMQWWLTDDRWEAIVESGYPALNIMAALPQSWDEDLSAVEIEEDLQLVAAARAGRVYHAPPGKKLRRNPPKSLVTVLDLKRMREEGRDDLLDGQISIGNIAAVSNHHRSASADLGTYGGSLRMTVSEMRALNLEESVVLESEKDAQMSLQVPLAEGFEDYLEQLSAVQCFKDRGTGDFVSKNSELDQTYAALRGQQEPKKPDRRSWGRFRIPMPKPGDAPSPMFNRL